MRYSFHILVTVIKLIIIFHKKHDPIRRKKKANQPLDNFGTSPNTIIFGWTEIARGLQNMIGSLLVCVCASEIAGRQKRSL